MLGPLNQAVTFVGGQSLGSGVAQFSVIGIPNLPACEADENVGFDPDFSGTWSARAPWSPSRARAASSPASTATCSWTPRNFSPVSPDHVPYSTSVTDQIQITVGSKTRRPRPWVSTRRSRSCWTPAGSAS